MKAIFQIDIIFMSKKQFKGHFRHVFRGEVEVHMDFIKAAFKTVIQRYVDEQVNVEDMGCETIEMEREEVDPQYVPSDVIATLPNSFHVTCLNYTVRSGETYLFMRIWEDSIENMLFQVVLKENEVLEQTTKVQ